MCIVGYKNDASTWKVQEPTHLKVFLINKKEGVLHRSKYSSVLCMNVCITIQTYKQKEATDILTGPSNYKIFFEAMIA